LPLDGFVNLFFAPKKEEIREFPYLPNATESLLLSLFARERDADT